MRKKTRAIIVTGSAGLIGAGTVRRFGREDYCVVGIDNDMRSRFFGPEASTQKTRDRLINDFHNYDHHKVDIRNQSAVENIFAQHQGQIEAVVHTAAQPLHDWAARRPHTDFGINAFGTLNLLEAARKFCPGFRYRLWQPRR